MSKPLKKAYSNIDVESTAKFILSIQKDSGEIPWSESGKTDPWDHVESAMGLTVGGYWENAKKAYLWSLQTQLPDGSWWSCYEQGKPQKKAYKDSNMTAYIAVGVFHYYMVTGDYSFLRIMWPTVCNALDYVVGLQQEEGQISWAQRGKRIYKKSLLTGSSSIHISLLCGLRIASLLGKQKPHWEMAKVKLANAIKFKPYLFDQSKSRFSMDWYYPILCGILRGKEAQKRIEESWDRFAIPGWGIRCVSDKPWLTMAESAELTMALAAMGDLYTANQVLSWIQNKRDSHNGAIWTGITYPDRIIYPEERTSWTAAAVLLAVDMLYKLTPASQLFSHNFLEYKKTTTLQVKPFVEAPPKS
ncbi:MAG: phenyltransferase domain-containing protein [Deferribacterota bacterium]|nr:phenyltransferase domain-containing protein [Deferribacterota bacterium]